jgi:ribulose-5-phosphate 4-epimerase/fuculose-1-phosphate aldolase
MRGGQPEGKDVATSQMNKVIDCLRRAVLGGSDADLTDGQLLECFVSRHDAAALEALVRRHGPMVWGVCKRVLCNHQDAEDAFQATFLVLLRKAGSLRAQESLAEKKDSRQSYPDR